MHPQVNILTLRKDLGSDSRPLRPNQSIYGTTMLTIYEVANGMAAASSPYFPDTWHETMFGTLVNRG